MMVDSHDGRQWRRSREEIAEDRLPSPYLCTGTSSLSEKTSSCMFGTPKPSGQTPTTDLDSEKKPSDPRSEEVGERVVLTDDDPMLKDLPWHVRRVVSLTDDPNLPTITFRYFVLILLFIPPGAFLQQLNMFRTTFAPYSIFFVQIAASYVGDWLARVLPSWEVRLPFTERCFSLNPGPFSVKEHVLVVIAAASGATYNLAWTPLSLSELYFGDSINPVIWIFFMWAIVWTGYSYAALARQFLIYDPQQPW